jgi:hypothetical protein
MPVMKRPNSQAEKIFRDIMGEPRNVSRKATIRKQKPSPDHMGYDQGEMGNAYQDIQKDLYEK